MLPYHPMSFRRVKTPFPDKSIDSPYLTLTIVWFAVFRGWPLPDSPYFTADHRRTIYFSRSRTSVSLWWGAGFQSVGLLTAICWCLSSPFIMTTCHGNVKPMLVQCWACVVDDGPTLDQHRVNTRVIRHLNTSQTNIRRHPILCQCWSTVYGACPPFHRH